MTTRDPPTEPSSKPKSIDIETELEVSPPQPIQVRYRKSESGWPNFVFDLQPDEQYHIEEVESNFSSESQIYMIKCSIPTKNLSQPGALQPLLLSHSEAVQRSSVLPREPSPNMFSDSESTENVISQSPQAVKRRKLKRPLTRRSRTKFVPAKDFQSINELCTDGG